MIKSRTFKITYIGPLRWLSGSDHLSYEPDNTSSVPGIHSGRRESIHESCPLSQMIAVFCTHPDTHTQNNLKAIT